MAKNPTTGLEQEEINVDENLGGIDTPEVLTETSGVLKGQQFTPAPGFDIKEGVGLPGVNLDPVKTDTVDFSTTEVETTGIKLPEVGDTTLGAAPLGADTIIDTTVDTIDTTIDTPDTTEGITGIEQIDTELGKLSEEKKTEIEDTFDSYNLAKGRFEENKGFYTNFDETNTKFEGVLASLRELQQSEDITNLTDEQLQLIANQNGVTLEQVKDPTTIFGGLDLTEQGKDELGVTSVQDQIDKMGTDFDRSKEDLAFNLEGQKAAINNQLEDVKIQLARNLAFMDAQGAFTGAFKSSGFQQGIQNVKDDGERTIARLEEQLGRVNQADATNIARLTEDFTKASTKAKKDLDDQLKAVKFDTGLQMNKLEDKFGLSSTELTKALDDINEEFGTKSMKVFSDYVDNMRKIQTITNDNIIQQDKIDQLTTAKVDRRFNELVANDGLLLQGASLTNLQNNVKDGTLTVQRFNDLKNLMQTSIVSTLNDSGTVNQADINSINSLMQSGMTPSQIVAKFQEGGRFTPSVADGKTQRFDLGGGKVRLQKSDGTFEDFQDGEAIVGDVDFSTVDFTTNEGLINKYPNEASFKNNNPAGITFGLSANGKSLLESAGIDFTLGTPRPEAEGGNYIKFNTAEDGVNAQKVLLAQAGSDDIHSRLSQWVGTENGEAYADDLIEQAGLTKGDTFTSITDDQLDTLVAVQMKRESPNFFNELSNSLIQSQEGSGIDKGEEGASVTETINGVKVILGSIGVPVTFERTIKSQIPATLLNSEVELKAANEVIKNLFSAGITPEEASAMFQGFKIRDVNDIKFGSNLLRASRTLIDKPEGLLANLSATINTGDRKGAVGFMERLKEKEIRDLNPDAPIRATSKTRIERLNNVLDTINELGGPGVISGSFSDWVGKLKDTDLARLQTKMERLNSEERLRLFGTSQTGGETGGFDPLSLKLGEKVTTLLGKIDEFKTDEIRLLNNSRGLSLPKLEELQILDDNELIKLYETVGGSKKDVEESAGALGSAGVQAGASLGFGGQTQETDLFDSLY